MAQTDKSKGSFWKFATGDPNEEPKPQSSLKLRNSKKQTITHPVITGGYRPNNGDDGDRHNRHSVKLQEKIQKRLPVKHMVSHHFQQQTQKTIKMAVKKEAKIKGGEVPVDDEESYLSPSLRCWSPIAQISRLSARESDDEGYSDGQWKRKKLTLNLDYGRDLKPVNLSSYLENLGPIEPQFVPAWFRGQNIHSIGTDNNSYLQAYYRRKYWTPHSHNYAIMYQNIAPLSYTRTTPITYFSGRKITNANNRLSDHPSIFCSE